MKIAFATTDERNIDEHFGRAGCFVIYELTREGYRLIEVRRFSEGTDREIETSRDRDEVHAGRVQSKVERLADCKIIFLSEIGGPSAARLIRKGIMPVKVKETTSIEAELETLLRLVNTNPPPWLKKAVNAP